VCPVKGFHLEETLHKLLTLIGNIRGRVIPEESLLKIFIIILYIRIVGNDDDGVTFTPDEYEKYKREVLPMVSNLEIFKINIFKRIFYLFSALIIVCSYHGLILMGWIVS
jgi:hypothetical protein